VKWRRDYRQPSIELYWRLSELHWGRTVVIWPETAIPAFPDEVAETLTRLDTVASERGSVVLVGMPTGSVDEGAYFNSVMAFGAVSGRYDKRRLVPFGEYLPFDRWLRQVLDFLRIPMSNFSRGQNLQVPVEVAGHRVGISICYEDAYASEIRRALPDAAFLVNVSNDAWFGDSIAPHQHLEIARARALETGRYLLRATNTGISAVIDDRGSVVTRSAQFQPATVIAEFQPRRGATPYVTYGEAPVALILFTIFAVAYARRNGV
jgi:apolipoprotein N-acyltransferase